MEGKGIVYSGGAAQLGPKVTVVWGGQFAENICLNGNSCCNNSVLSLTFCRQHLCPHGF